jgi:hypothetical protein
MGKRNTSSNEDLTSCLTSAEDAGNAAGKIIRAIESGGFAGSDEAVAHARTFAAAASTLADLSAKLLALHEMSASLSAIANRLKGE